MHFTEGDQPRPFICGGYNNTSGYIDSCYKYNATLDEWTFSGTMPEEKHNSGYDHSEMWGLVMAGGYNGGLVMAGGHNANYLSSVTTTESGEVFGPLPDLPNGKEHSCVVIIDEDRIFSCGGEGYGTRSETLIFSKSSGTWSR